MGTQPATDAATKLEGLGRQTVDRLAAPEPPLPAAFAGREARVHSHADGYLQTIDDAALMSLAVEHDLVVRLVRCPGDYIESRSVIALAYPAERASGEVTDELRDAFDQGRQRTPTQDVRFPIDQLVEVALRALSPGINDPFTAMNCVDRLASALIRLGGRQFPSSQRADEQGRVRVVAQSVSFESLVEAAIEPILAQAVQSRSAEVCDRISCKMRSAADLTCDPARRQALASCAASAGVAASRIRAMRQRRTR